MHTMKSLRFRVVGVIFTLSAILVFFTIALAASPYPSRPVRLVVPTSPGGGEDVVGRLIAANLTERLGVQVVVENHGGAGGVIGTEIVSKANPDGYTMLIATAKHTIQPAFEKLPYDLLKSFIPIARLGGGPYAFSINPNVPAKSVIEFINLAKQKPGQLICGTSGMGASPHMAAELFKMMAEIDFKIVHFKGAGPAMSDLLGGHSHALISSIPGQLPHIKSGKFRVLGTGGVKRSVILPDVPTIAEAGLPGFTAIGWYGILAPAGTPAPIVGRLNKEIKEILALDQVKKRLLNAGTEEDYLGLPDFRSFLEEEINRWAAVVKKANIKLE
jgi:tripartite-type tricarboxylate transporter receptor subunit TctC